MRRFWLVSFAVLLALVIIASVAAITRASGSGILEYELTEVSDDPFWGDGLLLTVRANADDTDIHNVIVTGWQKIDDWEPLFSDEAREMMSDLPSDTCVGWGSINTYKVNVGDRFFFRAEFLDSHGDLLNELDLDIDVE